MKDSVQLISKTFEELVEPASPHNRVVIVGSGYGGSVAASRLSKCLGEDVCLLERGLEILPGNYPDDLNKVRLETQLKSAEFNLYEPTALFDFHMNSDMNALVGCGLGGTSLINANVALEIDYRILKDGIWPAELNETLMRKYYGIAKERLGSNPYPDDAPELNKLSALEVSADELGLPFSKPDINVTFNEGKPNWAGIKQKACNNCGDCCSGCNYGAKNTTLMNYLPDAYQNGARIYTCTTVDKVCKKNGVWELQVYKTSDEGKTKQLVTADILIIAAGTLGTAGILLRSKKLKLSSKLGKGFSGNGDVLGFGYNSYWKSSLSKKKEEKKKEKMAKDGWGYSSEVVQPQAIYGIGIGSNDVPQKKYPGPCITGLIDTREVSADWRDGMVIEEGVIPGAFASILPPSFFFGDIQAGNFFRFGDAEERLKDAAGLAQAIQEDPGSVNSLAYNGATSRLQTYLVMSHDEENDAGELKLDDNENVRIHWPGVGQSRNVVHANYLVSKVSDAVRGEYLPNPLWSDAMGKQLVTVHPLGGCCFADEGKNGVVNYKCQVFTGDTKNVYADLYVCDGSVLPESVGVNPLLTITAIAEHTCDELIKDHKLQGEGACGKEVPQLLRDVKIDNSSRLPKLPIANVLNSALIWLPKKWVMSRLKEGWLRGRDERFEHSLSFVETMEGFGSLLPDSYCANKASISNQFKVAERIGKAEGHKWSMKDLKVDTGGLSEFISNAEHKGSITHGSIICQTLMPSQQDGIKIKNGDFYLLKVDESRVETWMMVYNIQFDVPKSNIPAAELGEYGSFWMLGTKYMHDKPGSAAWSDLTTLFVDLYKADPEGGAKPIGKGVLHLAMADLVKQAGTIEVRPINEWLINHKENAKIWIKKIDVWLNKKIEKNSGKRMKTRLLKVSQRLLGIIESKLIMAKDAIEIVFLARFVGFFGITVFESYGGILSDVKNFPLDRYQEQAEEASVAEEREIARSNIGNGLKIRKLLKVKFRKLKTLLQEKFEIVRSESGILGKIKDLLRTKSQPQKSKYDGDEYIKKVYKFWANEKNIEKQKLCFGNMPSWMRRGTKDSLFVSTRPARLKLTRYYLKFDKSNKPVILGDTKPVVLAPGFSVKASSFATETVDVNLVDALLQENFDVWLFDYRASEDSGNKQTDFTLDDIALEDWPAAINKIQNIRDDGKPLQVVAHCVGSMSLLMSILSGELDDRLEGARDDSAAYIRKNKVSGAVCSQLTLHPVTNCLNYVKADIGMVDLLGDKMNLEGLDIRSGGKSDKEVSENQKLDTVLWNIPVPEGEECKNPVCRRIFAVFGPSYKHSQLNHQTHEAMREMFGEVSLKPFEHLSSIIGDGRVENAVGKDVYLPHFDRLKLPLSFMAGSDNQLFYPETSMRTLNWLEMRNLKPGGPKIYDRHIFQGYAHMDCFIGKNASKNKEDGGVYWYILEQLKEQSEKLKALEEFEEKSPSSILLQSGSKEDSSQEAVTPSEEVFTAW
ncbi:MAG: choline dehydrogenase-like flavoprotein [Candidatus Azotimanducaceae bacterium]|jgi:choline dehydrogenase-like flavoprotein